MMREPERRMPCASILKPVYVALAGDVRPADARRSIVRSDNVATGRIVEQLGGPEALLDRLREWAPGLAFDPLREPSWGRIMVTHADIATLYRKLVLHRGDVLELMHRVAEPQRFGTGPGTAMKAGWDLWPDDGAGKSFLFTHLVRCPGAPRISVSTGLREVGPADVAQWNDALATGGPEAVIPLHPHPQPTPIPTGKATR